MTVDSYLGLPCDACGAPSGQECNADCDYVQAWNADPDPVPESEVVEFSDLEMPDEAQVEDEPMNLDVMARSALFQAASKLPYGGLVGDPPDPRQFEDTDMWLAKYAVWMADYQKVILGQVNDLQGQARKYVGLQIERDFLRGFLGEAIDKKLGEAQ